MSEQSEKFTGWAIVEVMGHKKFAGFVSEQLIAGAALVRVDVPETQHETRNDDYSIVATKGAYTKLIGVASIYCITPCDEALARRAAQVLERWSEPIPVSLPQLVAGPSTPTTDAEIVGHLDDDDDDNTYDDLDDE